MHTQPALRTCTVHTWRIVPIVAFTCPAQFSMLDARPHVAIGHPASAPAGGRCVGFHRTAGLLPLASGTAASTAT